MPLSPRVRDFGAMARDTITVIYRVVQSTIDSAVQHIHAKGLGDTQVVQQAEIDLAQHYGFRSRPPNGTEHIVFRGIGFEGGRGDAVVVRKGASVQLIRCEVRNVGRHAVQLLGGTGHKVVGCDIHHVGCLQDGPRGFT